MRLRCVCLCVWLILLNLMSSRFIRVVTNGRISFFLVTENYPTVWVCTHTFLPHFLYSCIYWCALRLFHILASVNNAEMRHCLTFFGYKPGSRIAGSYCGSIFFIFWETSILFFIMAAPAYISINNEQKFPFLHSFTISCYDLSF